MTVLVDPPLWPAHGRHFSHLVSDSSLAELHAFARAAGLPGRARQVARVLAGSEGRLPWHRVVRADGRIAFAPGSAQAAEQAAALQAEGVVVVNGRVGRAWRPAPALDAWLWQQPDQPPV